MTLLHHIHCTQFLKRLLAPPMVVARQLAVQRQQSGLKEGGEGKSDDRKIFR